MKLSRREIVLLLLLVIVAGGMGFFLFWYAPAAAKITELGSQIEQKKNEIEEAKLRQTQYDLFLETKKSEDERANSDEDIPSVFDEAEAIRIVESIVAGYTTDLVIFFREPVSFARTEIYPVNISFKVTYDELVRILRLFERENSKIRVLHGTFALDSFIGEKPVLRASIEAEYLVLYGE